MRLSPSKGKVTRPSLGSEPDTEGLGPAAYLVICCFMALHRLVQKTRLLLVLGAPMACRIKGKAVRGNRSPQHCTTNGLLAGLSSSQPVEKKRKSKRDFNALAKILLQAPSLQSV